MNIAKWIEDKFKSPWDISHKRMVIYVDDLEELLKTHTLVPNEPTEAMVEAGDGEIIAGMYNSDLPCGNVYKAMLEASKEEV